MVALITGSSSGIGLELAKVFARNNYELILVSANQEKLEEAASQIDSARIRTVAVDLSTPEGPQKLRDAVHEPVDVLVNNAGVGVQGEFAGETSLRDELAMIQLNATSVVHITKLFLPEMMKRGSGKILMTASIAALMPTPLATVYGATKAFVFSFAEGLRAELKDSGITVTALLPGETDTDWFARAGADESEARSDEMADPADVAQEGYDALMKGSDHIVVGWSNKLAAWLASVLPKPATVQTIK